MKVAVAGSTGLIGGELLEVLSGSSEISEIAALARREGKKIPKVNWVQTDFNSLESIGSAVKNCEKAFCCLGTTIKKAGSQEAFEKVDLDFVVNFAKACKSNGIETFSVVSAIGSDANSSVFYNRTKGKMEAALKGVDFKSLIIAQPSILLGDRKENRLGERIGIVVMKLFAPLMLGSLKKYRPIHARSVAKGMYKASKNNSQGVKILEFEELSEAGN